MNSIIDNYRNLINHVKQICNSLNKPFPVILAVSKTHPITSILEIYNQGHRNFGENYVQELMDKAKQLQHLDIIWHFIGHIQSNKIKHIVQYADYIHGLSEMHHAHKINNYCTIFNKNIKVLIEVNISNKDCRNGVHNFAEISQLADYITNLPKLKLIGIMGMATNTNNIEVINNEFSNLYHLFKKLKALYPQINTLSMGMSQDYQLALKNNSTLIRIGSSIFGSRTTTTK